MGDSAIQHIHPLYYIESDAAASVSEFCIPGGMVMYMNGFHFALNTASPSKHCINLWFAGWSLDSVEKFLLAMVGVIVLGIATEGIGALRVRLHKKMLRKTQIHQTEVEKKKRERLLKITNTGFHGIQGFLGYMLMLAVMTYSIEMLLSCLFGVVLGYFIFYSDLSSSVPGMNSNPCCDFMTNSADVEPEVDRETYSSNSAMSENNITLFANEEIRPGEGVRKRYDTRTGDEEEPNDGGCCVKTAPINEQNNNTSMLNPLLKKI